MKRTAMGLFASLVLVCTTAFSQQLPEDPALQGEIHTLDQAHAQAIFSGDTDALDKVSSATRDSSAGPS